MADDIPAITDSICPNCGEPMALTTTIRRAFDDDTGVFQCRPCGVSITKTVKKSPGIRADTGSARRRQD